MLNKWLSWKSTAKYSQNILQFLREGKANAHSDKKRPTTQTDKLPLATPKYMPSERQDGLATKSRHHQPRKRNRNMQGEIGEIKAVRNDLLSLVSAISRTQTDTFRKCQLLYVSKRKSICIFLKEVGIHFCCGEAFAG